MGKTALTSHSKTQKHVELLNVSKVGGHSSIGLFVSEKPVPSSSTEKRTPSAASYVTRNDVTSAEVLWCLNTVDKNMSFVSKNDITAVFKQFFTDSDIAKRVSCRETKSMYVINYGIAPYYRCQLERKLKNQPFVLMFDETLTREMQQKQQLDIIVSHWDDNIVHCIHQDNGV